MAEELWQLFDEQGRAIPGRGATKQDVGKGLLHAASHVWVWRRKDGVVEVLVQKRAAGKRTWPNRLDASAAGHIDLGEEPVAAAVREAQEELGVAFLAEDLRLIGVIPCNMAVEDTGLIENEFHWMFLVELSDATFTLAVREVGSVLWKDPAELKAEIADRVTYDQKYLPHTRAYFATLFDALDRL